ncbi:MAG: rhodanese-like domain-containing protein [Thermodesulfobacteriota bacterium]
MLWQVPLLLAIACGLALAVNHFRPGGIPLMADWSPAARLKAVTGQSMIVPLAEAVSFYERREAVFVDARLPEEFAAGHIPGALNVPWVLIDEYEERFFKAVPDPQTIVIVYCDGEACSLSEDLARMLIGMGYVHVKVLADGWGVWTRGGYPVEKKEAP